MNRNEQCLREIIDILNKIGAPINTKGYLYLKEAIYYVLSDDSADIKMMSGIYPHVAEEFKISVERVERAIRYTTSKLWVECNKENVKRLLNYNPVRANSIKNGEIIFLIANSVKYKKQ